MLKISASKLRKISKQSVVSVLESQLQKLRKISRQSVVC